MNDFNQSETSITKRRQDPLLQELWDVKAQINKAANYDLRRLVENAKAATAQFISPNGRVQIPANWR